MIVDELIALLGFEFKGGGDLAKFENGLKKGEAAANGFVGKLGKMAVAAGAAFAAIGGLTLGAGFLSDSVQDAIDFESALTGIQKKAGATAEQMGAVREEILAMGASGEVAQSFDELAAAFERGAAAGIPVDELRDFTMLSAKASDAFEMDAEKVSNAFLGFKTTFGIPLENMERVADLVNSLADAGIADESGIIDFMDRVGATMKTAGFSIEQIAGIGTALQNLKVPAEVAATAMRSVSLKLMAPQSLSKDGKKAFQSLLGNPQEFVKLMQKDAPAAMDKLFTKLQKLDPSKRSGAIVDIFGLEHAGTVLTMVEGYAEVQRNLKLAADEQAFLGSLGKSYALKLDDSAAILKVMQNRFKRVRITLGNEILPILNKAARKTGEWMDDLYNSGAARRFGQGLARVLDMTMTVAERAAIFAYRIGRGFYKSAEAVVGFTSKVTGLDKELAAVALTAGGLAMTGFGRGILRFAAARAPIALAALAVEDLFRAFNGEESYIGSLDGAQGIIDQIKADAAAAGKSFNELASSLNDIFGIQVADGQTPLDALTRAATALINTELLQFLRDVSALLKEVTGFTDRLNARAEYVDAIKKGREKEGKEQTWSEWAFGDVGEEERNRLAKVGGYQGDKAPEPIFKFAEPTEEDKSYGFQAGEALRNWISGWFSSSEANNAATQQKLDNLSANMNAMGTTGATVTSTITNNDQRAFPVTNNVSAPVTVNVQQATQAPAAVGNALSNVVRSAAVPPARIAGGNAAP